MEYRETFDSKSSPACPDSKPSPEQEELFYSVAYNAYEQGNYPVAARLFRQLVLTTPFVRDYWKGLAAAEQMQQAYEAALHAWGMVALLDDSDPLPHFHAGECYFFLNDFVEAGKALDLAEERQATHSPSNLQLTYSIQTLKSRITPWQHPSMESAR